MGAQTTGIDYYDLMGRVIRGNFAEEQATYMVKCVSKGYAVYKREKTGAFSWRITSSLNASTNWIHKDVEKNTKEQERIEKSRQELTETWTDKIQTRLLAKQAKDAGLPVKVSVGISVEKPVGVINNDTEQPTKEEVQKKKRGRPPKTKTSKTAKEVVADILKSEAIKADGRIKDTKEDDSDHAHDDSKAATIQNDTKVQEVAESSANSTVKTVTEVSAGGNITELAKLVYSRIKSHTKMSVSETADWLMVCLARNKWSKRQNIINTRLVDIAGQPIYILDRTALTDEPIGDKGLSIIDTLYQAKALFPSCNNEELPEPIQWTDNYSDLIWNPTKKVLPMTSDAIRHIFEERIHRFPENLQSIPRATLIKQFRLEMENEGEKAARDCAYALPCYSSTYNKVTMMLPVHIMSDTDSKPEVVMLFNSKYSGYELYTVLTPEEAYRTVKLLRNPDTTWLKGVR